jgi:hypothetical protein
MPSGAVTGTVSFSILPSRGVDGSGSVGGGGDVDLLYTEKGVFSPVGMAPLEVSAYYIFALDQRKDSLEVYFADKDSRSRRDGLFVPLPLERCAGQGWSSSAFHQCSEDGYRTRYSFEMKGLQVERMVIAFDVSGPHKRYRSHTVLTRADPTW